MRTRAKPGGANLPRTIDASSSELEAYASSVRDQHGYLPAGLGARCFCFCYSNLRYTWARAYIDAAPVRLLGALAQSLTRWSTTALLQAAHKDAAWVQS